MKIVLLDHSSQTGCFHIFGAAQVSAKLGIRTGIEVGS